MAYENDEKDERNNPGFECPQDFMSPQAHGEVDECSPMHEFMEASLRNQERIRNMNSLQWEPGNMEDYKTIDEYMQSQGQGGRTWGPCKKD